MHVLVTWIGFSDLRAAAADEPGDDPGPVLRLLRQRTFDVVHLLNDVPDAEKDGQAAPSHYREWLATRCAIDPARIVFHHATAGFRNQYGPTYLFTTETLREVCQAHAGAAFALLLSPGTPAAQVAMILAAQKLFSAEPELFNSYQPRGEGDNGVEVVRLPFALSVDEALPRLLARALPPEHEPESAAFDAIKGTSRAIREANAIARRVALFDGISVLVRGETGTGKELFARAIHEASPRRGRPFVALNCAAMPAELLESLLFGHVKGAFTSAVQNQEGAVAAADGGTLFLDEVGDMPAGLQAKLLRFLQDQCYAPLGSNTVRQANVRVLSATNRHLEADVSVGRFRADLFHRLNVLPIHLPPLWRRGRDAELLARHFLEQFNARYKTAKVFAEEALACLTRYPWPGNVRELDHAVTRMAVFSEDIITREDVGQWLGEPGRRLGRPLRDLDGAELLAYTAAVVDELLTRFKAPGGLPGEPAAEPDFFEDLLHPLVRGRAYRAAGEVASQAGLLFKNAKMDLTPGKADRRYLDRYRETLAARLDEDLIRQIRGVLE